MSYIFMDTGEEEKSVEQIIGSAGLCPAAQSSYRYRPKKCPNPNQEFALENDIEHLIFMYVMDLGKELELKGKGGEK